MLALQCLISICEGFALFAFPLYSAIAVQRPRAAGDPVVTAPPALDLTSLPDDEPSTKALRTVGAMVEDGWPGLLSALSFFISTNLSDDLFADTLNAFQNLTNVAGVLGLRTPRDAFLTSLARFAIPPGVVSSVDAYVEPVVPKTASVSDALGFSALAGGSGPPPALSERNMACLKVIISTAIYLAGSLGATWFDILEVLQNADYVIHLKGLRGSGGSKKIPHTPTPSTVTPRPSKTISTANSPMPVTSPNPSAAAANRPPLLIDLDIETVQLAINRLYDTSKSLDDDAFKDFARALCKLSGEMVGMQASKSLQEIRASESLDETGLSAGPASAAMSPSPSSSSPFLGLGTTKSSRRVSGMGAVKPSVSWERVDTVAICSRRCPSEIGRLRYSPAWRCRPP